MTEHIILYGKGGVGTSTLTSNLSAALVEAGFRVLQVGCSRNGDACLTLNGGVAIPTVWEQYEKFGALSFDSVVTRGFKSTYCIELGRPECDQGVTSSVKGIELLLDSELIPALFPDYVLYDVSGDQSHAVMRTLLDRVAIHRLFAITSADFMALTAVNSLLELLENYAENHVPVAFGGVIPNGIVSSFEESFISDFAKHVNGRVLNRIPRSQMVRQCELYGKTVIEASPLSNQSYFYRRLANQVVDESRGQSVQKQLHPLSREELRLWAREWADRLYALENGLVSDGAAI
jgi:nitrogenase iron protein NifH